MNKIFLYYSKGPLASVVNLAYSLISASKVNISWSPPFTLPGTFISGYNITCTFGTTGNYMYFTPDTFYVLAWYDKRYSGTSCYDIHVSVSGYNGLNGEKNMASHLCPSTGFLNKINLFLMIFICNVY